MYNVKIVLDSISSVGARLTTWELTYPRFVHSELMTHRVFSRNAASSRAIPVEKLIQQVKDDPVYPKVWGKNQKGMQARQELSIREAATAKYIWGVGLRHALQAADDLRLLGVHKQLVNRVIEPWMFITTIVTATEFDNFYGRRDHPDAQPEIAWVAKEMRKQHKESIPNVLKIGEWHLPYILQDDVKEVRESVANDLSVDPTVDSAVVTMATDYKLRKISTARCARVSYLTHDGKRDHSKDLQLHDQLLTDLHMSPFEHPAQALPDKNKWSGNFRGWGQYRKLIPNEDGTAV